MYLYTEDAYTLSLFQSYMPISWILLGPPMTVQFCLVLSQVLSKGKLVIPSHARLRDPSLVEAFFF